MLQVEKTYREAFKGNGWKMNSSLHIYHPHIMHYLYNWIRDNTNFSFEEMKESIKDVIEIGRKSIPRGKIEVSSTDSVIEIKGTKSFPIFYISKDEVPQDQA